MRGGINVTGAHVEKAAQRLEEFTLIIKLSVSTFFTRFTDNNDNFRVSVSSMSLSVLSLENIGEYPFGTEECSIQFYLQGMQ